MPFFDACTKRFIYLFLYSKEAATRPILPENSYTKGNHAFAAKMAGTLFKDHTIPNCLIK